MKSPHVVAFCPGHISGYFKRIQGDTVATTGSIGAGIVISEGVTVIVKPADHTSICIRCRGYNGKTSEEVHGSPLLEHVMENLTITASVVTESILPISAGFGLSAAALLATLTALNRLYSLEMGAEEIAEVAHAAEVAHHTGLGDVAACQGGGRVMRYGPGIHGRIERRFDMPQPIYAVSFGPIHTPTVLGSSVQMDRISGAFPKTIPKDYEDFFLLSRHFAEMSGLITEEVRDVMRLCDAAGIASGMTMLGNGIFAYGKKAHDVLLPSGHVFELHVAATGARVLEERL
jgi:pantoate kinase